MTDTINMLASPPDRELSRIESTAPALRLNGFTVQRIVYELIKKYMIANTPADCGITLAQRFDPDPTKSKIFLDVAYNWKTQFADKVPAIYVQRGDIDLKSPTMGQGMGYDAKESEDERLSISTMPVRVTCIAAQPIAVVENLAEYVKQPLLCFRKEVKLDFRLRDFRLSKITSPVLVKEGKDNFMVELLVNTAFDEGWIIQKDDLKMKTIGVEMFDDLVKPMPLSDDSTRLDLIRANDSWVAETLLGPATI